MKNKIFDLFYFFYDRMDASNFYFLSALSLSGSLFFFLSSTIEPRPDLFYPKIISSIVGCYFLVSATHKHIKEGL